MRINRILRTSTQLNAFKSTLKLGYKEVPKVMTSFIYDKFSILNNWYTRLIGLDEVRVYQDRVVILQVKRQRRASNRSKLIVNIFEGETIVGARKSQKNRSRIVRNQKEVQRIARSAAENKTARRLGRIFKFNERGNWRELCWFIWKDFDFDLNFLVDAPRERGDENVHRLR